MEIGISGEIRLGMVGRGFPKSRDPSNFFESPGIQKIGDERISGSVSNKTSGHNRLDYTDYPGTRMRPAHVWVRLTNG